MSILHDFADVDLERHILHKRCMHRMLGRQQGRGLHHKQLPLLTVLQRCGSSSQIELANMLHISPASIAVSLRRLEAGGFVRRLPVPGNLRANRVELTETGDAAATRAREILRETTRQMLFDFSEEETAQLIQFCRRMRDNLRRCADSFEYNETEESL